MRKGSILFQLLIMLFFMGIMLITIIPLISSSDMNSKRIKRNNELIYIGEMVVEKLKTKSEIMKPILQDLENIGKVYYEDEDFDTSEYRCIISKINSNMGILEFLVRVESKDEKNLQYIEFKASVPK